MCAAMTMQTATNEKKYAAAKKNCNINKYNVLKADGSVATSPKLVLRLNCAYFMFIP